MAEGQETSDYPGSLDTWQTVTDKEDIVEQSDINKMKAAIEAVQTELGTDPAGTKTDVDTRLDQCIAENGAMRNGTSNPASGAQDGDFFYRTDQNLMYIYDGSTWNEVGTKLSSTVFSIGAGNHDINTDSTLGRGWDVTSTKQPTTGTNSVTIKYICGDTTYRTLYTSKFYKIAGINTIRVYAWLSNENASYTTSCEVSVGGQTVVLTVTGTTIAEDSDTIDVSGLSNGTAYDVTLKLKTSNSGDFAHFFGAIAFGES